MAKNNFKNSQRVKNNPFMGGFVLYTIGSVMGHVHAADKSRLVKYKSIGMLTVGMLILHIEAVVSSVS